MSQDLGSERRLVAVLAADVAGFSRLTEADEVGTLRMLAAQRTILDSAITKHRGRIANTAGDSVLAEFPSAVNAVQCAVDAQQALRDAAEDTPADRRVLFRIGIHVGDVMVRDGDLLGTGVNVAARLEALADAGGTVLSAAAHEQVKKILPLAYTDLGPQSVKNIEEPVRAFAIGQSTVASTTANAQPEPDKPLPLPDKPSIAVLPFQNMSGDPEQEYFADGMVEDIITALSRFKSLFVIARNSSFTYKAKAVDIKQVGRELGVRYVLEGSVRKASGRVRITGQLIEAATGAHLWADRFDGSLENVFELQDEVANAVAGALDPVLYAAEVARVRRKPLASFDAYDYFLRASDYANQWNNEAIETARPLFYRAIELAPDFAQAYAFNCWCFVWRTMRFGRPAPEEQREAERMAREAARLGKDDGFCLTWAGHSLQVNSGLLEEGADLINRALDLNANLARSWNLSGASRLFLRQPETALVHLQRAMRLSPLDSAFHAMEALTAQAYLQLGRYEETAHWATRSMNRLPSTAAGGLLALSKAAAGDLEGARRAVQRVLQIDPNRRISVLLSMPVLSRLPPERRAWLADMYRKGGMPE